MTSVRYSFLLMFCCFSKKKKKSQYKPPKPLPLKIKPNTKVTMTKPSLQIIPERSPEESQQSNRQWMLVKDVKHFENIDNIIKQQIQSEKIKQISEDAKNLSKFCDINCDSESSSSDQDHNFQRCNVTPSDELEEGSRKPKKLFKTTHSLEEMNSLTFPSIRESSSRDLKSTKKKSDRWSLKTQGFELDKIEEEQNQSKFSTIVPYDTITLDNFHQTIQKIIPKENDQEETLNQTFQEAENGFYCKDTSINEQFSRAVIAYNSPQLPGILFLKMTNDEKNKTDSKGYTPVQLIVMKTLRHSNYLHLAKVIAYNDSVNLECRNPSGWTPLQEALIHRNIPLSTNLFRAVYMKRQQSYKRGLANLAELLSQMPDFTLDISVKVDSFIPLVGALTPSDILKVTKVRDKINLDYSLVGYSFPLCKRRQMSIFFDGTNMWGLNHSKRIYCDLLQDLDQQEMLLVIQDMLTTEIKRGEPIVHSVTLSKSLSLFDNEIIEQIGGFPSKKYELHLCYTSTAEKRKSTLSNVKELNFVNDYGDYQLRKEEIVIKEKNRNKKIQLEVWLAENVQLQLNKLIQILEVLGAGNTLLSKWSSFLKEKIGDKLEEEKLFPIKIDVPLNYSLYFNIQFGNYCILEPETEPLTLSDALKKVQRKQFQGLSESKIKRKFLIEAYT